MRRSICSVIIRRKRSSGGQTILKGMRLFSSTNVKALQLHHVVVLQHRISKTLRLRKPFVKPRMDVIPTSSEKGTESLKWATYPSLHSQAIFHSTGWKCEKNEARETIEEHWCPELACDDAAQIRWCGPSARISNEGAKNQICRRLHPAVLRLLGH